MRVYVPLTLDQLAQAHAAAGLEEDVERIEAQDESEEGEYAALMTAADVSSELSGGAGLRVVLVADVSEPAIGIPLSSWAAVHVDTQADADPDDDLAWYAIQEIPGLIGGR